MRDPVCLIHGGHEGLRVSEEGIRLLESLNEPIAVVCLAGQYRTGKSFFLNQLTRTKQRLEQSTKETTDQNGMMNGFKVGPTTESCTRGIWLWDPQPSIRNARGGKVLFMDTEGIAATDNDESYDAKIFSLGLLLSSLFVFNTMGVIDEAAIDRLFLVSELTKHVCVSSNTHPNDAPTRKPVDDLDEDQDDPALSDPLAESRELAPHFPPFIWLLRDFMLDMQVDGKTLTPNEYLEKSLELRDTSSRRNEERNRIRTSIRVLFAKRECLTLVRPVMDELQLRHAAELTEDDLRPEFVTQMQSIRDHILSVVSPKQLFGRVMDGRQLAHLVKCYTETMNSGSIPDIKAAWEYVSEATCQMALLTAIEAYDTVIQTTNQEEEEGQEPVIISQQEFEKIHKDAQDQALNIFKSQSVEGTSRTSCFQRLKQHIQRQKTAQIALLQKRSTAWCEKMLADLRQTQLIQPIETGAWDVCLDGESSAKSFSLRSVMNNLEEQYEARAQGPSKKTVLYNFLRNDVLVCVQQLYDRLTTQVMKQQDRHQKTVEQLDQEKLALESMWQQKFHETQMQVERLHDTKAHLEEKERMHLGRIATMEHDAHEQQTVINALEERKKTLKLTVDTLQHQVQELERSVEKTQLTLQHREETLAIKEKEITTLKHTSTEEREQLRSAHQEEKEQWIRKLADQTADKTTLSKQLKQKETELQQRGYELELLRTNHDQLMAQYDDEVAVRKQKEKDCVKLRDLNVQLESRLEESFARQLRIEDDVEKERLLLQARCERFQAQLGSIEATREVQQALNDCVTEVIRLNEVDKANVLSEERNVLQERLGELYLKISTLPDFYQRQIFCSPDPEPNFFEALTS